MKHKVDWKNWYKKNIIKYIPLHLKCIDNDCLSNCQKQISIHLLEFSKILQLFYLSTLIHFQIRLPLNRLLFSQINKSQMEPNQGYIWDEGSVQTIFELSRSKRIKIFSYFFSSTNWGYFMKGSRTFDINIVEFIWVLFGKISSMAIPFTLKIL